MKMNCFTRRSLLITLFMMMRLLAMQATAQDSSQYRISLLTCTPGEELYSTFGHSAVRVLDTGSGTDLVYNYGTFNFDEPGFYMKFIRGKLLYYLSVSDFGSFRNEYRESNRGITEQVLNLDQEQEKEIISLLENNMLPQNRAYKYDFLYDNCTTRLRDLVEKISDSSVKLSSHHKSRNKFQGTDPPIPGFRWPVLE